MSAKLIIDLDKTRRQGQSPVQCSYKHHPQNKGFDALLELIRFALICRRCEGAPCVTACPRGALEKVPSAAHEAGILKRANMLCTGCGTCALACPFGTVYGDLVLFPSSVCDVCRDRLPAGGKPLCVQTCTDGSIEYAPVEPGDGMAEIFEDIVVKVTDGSTWKPILTGKQGARR